MKTHIKIKLALASTLLSFNVFAAGDLHLDHANTDISDTASLQNGAKLFMNYCSGCHAIGFMRYNRIAQDLNLSDSLMAEHLMFAGDKWFDAVTAKAYNAAYKVPGSRNAGLNWYRANIFAGKENVKKFTADMPSTLPPNITIAPPTLVVSAKVDSLRSNRSKVCVFHRILLAS